MGRQIGRSYLMGAAAVVSAVLACGWFAPAGGAALLIDVVNTNDAGPGSLRAAITTANGSSGKDTIRFFVTGTISITSGPLPVVTDPVVIDGRTAPGFSGDPLVRVDNATGSSVDGFEISAGSTELYALSITGFGNGVVLDTNSGSTVAGNWIGLDLAGSASGNDRGVLVSSNGNTVGRTADAVGNVISGNSNDAVTITGSGVTGNVVKGNDIGTNTAGTAAVANGGQGVAIAGGATGNSVGGSATAARNVISGNSGNGVQIGGAGTSKNDVNGNFIGTDAAGTAAIANGDDGVAVLDGATSNSIGTGALNVLSGNAHFGASIRGAGTSGNVVGGNYVGTAADGLTALPNASSGVAVLSGATTNTIGAYYYFTGARNVISGNALHGVQIAGVGTSGNRVGANFIGLDKNGTTKLPNGGSGISIEDGATGNGVGAGKHSFWNYIAGNAQDGVEITGAGTADNGVAGNAIGIPKRGTNAVGNARSGVLIADGATDNRIGGASSASHNSIAGNGFAGVEIDGLGCATIGGRFASLGTTGNAVSANTIGSSTWPNGTGVAILAGATDNTVGGPITNKRNVISGNTNDGVLISDCGTSGNAVEGNYIGTDYSGQSALPNGGDGVRITSAASDNVIGGVKAGTRNVISGNTKQGVAIQAAESNVVQGNYVGTNAGATAAIPNGKDGVSLFSGATSNLIGGTTAAARNLISGNAARGMTIGGDGTNGNLVQGNYVGTNPAGTAALPNDTGIAVQRGASQNTIGGTDAGAGNLVSGNTSGGILLTDDGGTPPGSTSGNLIQGNLVGTDPAGTSAVPNGGFGVLFTDGPKNNTLGGAQAGTRNTIAFNDGDGVRVQSPDSSFTTFGDSILGNAIFDNAGLGISLLTGGNHLQPAPVIKSVSTSGGTTTVKARLTGSAASTDFRIELYSNPVCDPSGAGEGKDFVAAKAITTGSTGTKTFTIAVPTLAPGLQLTETATNLANGDTSEFSGCGTVP
jgi:hypothetical protein